MLIIFDLDDTLIDTSGSVTPFKMKECLECLVAQGLPIQDFRAAYRDLLALNEYSPRSKDALSRFIALSGGSADLIQRMEEVLTSPLPPDFQVPTTPHAKEILEILGQAHTLALVTGGHPPFQQEKLKKAGIDSSIFSKIHIPEDSVKKPYYKGLFEEYSSSPSQVVVCGDRIAMDLLPAYELGFTTVHMRWGRGAKAETETWIRYSISNLGELRGIIK